MLKIFQSPMKVRRTHFISSVLSTSVILVALSIPISGLNSEEEKPGPIFLAFDVEDLLAQESLCDIPKMGLEVPATEEDKKRKKEEKLKKKNEVRHSDLLDLVEEIGLLGIQSKTQVRVKSKLGLNNAQIYVTAQPDFIEKVSQLLKQKRKSPTQYSVRLIKLEVTPKDLYSVWEGFRKLEDSSLPSELSAIPAHAAATLAKVKSGMKDEFRVACPLGSSAYTLVATQSAMLADAKVVEKNGKKEIEPIVGVLTTGRVAELEAPEPAANEAPSLKLKITLTEAKHPIATVKLSNRDEFKEFKLAEKIELAVPELYRASQSFSWKPRLKEWQILEVKKGPASIIKKSKNEDEAAVKTLILAYTQKFESGSKSR